jgi:hypothetical protein
MGHLVDDAGNDMTEYRKRLEKFEGFWKTAPAFLQLAAGYSTKT